MRQRLLHITTTLLVLSGCHKSIPFEDVIISTRYSQVDHEAQVNIDNRIHENICFPSRLFTSESGTMELLNKGRHLIPYRENEYTSDINKIGSFFIVDSASKHMIPLDLSQYDLPPGNYTYKVMITWLKCSEVGKEGAEKLLNSRNRVFVGKISN